MKSIYAVVGLVLEDYSKDSPVFLVSKRYSIKQYRLVDITDGSIIDVDKSDYESLLGSNKIYFEDTNLLSFTHVDLDKYGEAKPVSCSEVHGRISILNSMCLNSDYDFCYSFIVGGKTVYKDNNRYMALGMKKLDYGVSIRLVYEHKEGSIFLNVSGLGIETFNIGYCNSYPMSGLDFIGKVRSLVGKGSYAVDLDCLLDSIQVLDNGCIYMNDICILTSESAGDVIVSNDTRIIVVGDVNRKVDSGLNRLVVPPSVENVIYSKFSLGRYGSNTKLYLSNKLSSDTIDKICDAVLGLDANKLDDAIELDNNVEFY